MGPTATNLAQSATIPWLLQHPVSQSGYQPEGEGHKGQAQDIRFSVFNKGQSSGSFLSVDNFGRCRPSFQTSKLCCDLVNGFKTFLNLKDFERILTISY